MTNDNDVYLWAVCNMGACLVRVCISVCVCLCATWIQFLHTDLDSFKLVKCIQGVFVLFVRFVVFVSFEKSLGFKLRNEHAYDVTWICTALVGNDNGDFGNVMKA